MCEGWTRHTPLEWQKNSESSRSFMRENMNPEDTAPPSGTGDVVLFAGGVDSNCSMTSLEDDAKMVSMTLSEGIAAGAPLAKRGRDPGARGVRRGHARSRRVGAVGGPRRSRRYVGLGKRKR
jgi:hypothetical protein